MPFYPSCGGIYSFVYTCFEERLHNFAADEKDDLKDFLAYFENRKNFKMFLEEYCFMELDDTSNLKRACVNDALGDSELFEDIQTEIENYKEADPSMFEEEKEETKSESSSESEEDDEN